MSTIDLSHWYLKLSVVFSPSTPPFKTKMYMKHSKKIHLKTECEIIKIKSLFFLYRVRCWRILLLFNLKPHNDHRSSSGPRSVKLCKPVNFSVYYLELYKNKFKNLIQTSKFKCSFWGQQTKDDCKFEMMRKVLSF